ncbi:MAG: hypothetical protein H0W21_10380 [Actinobacteria bacterium]|nr:hypothetical protein [Actinomycetota bacterium]
MADPNRRSVIITFEPKEQRPDKDKDKQEVLLDSMESRIQFLDAQALAAGAAPLPSAPPETVGYDVKQYEVPILTASLTDSEIDALRANGNVESLEDDEEMWPLKRFPPRLRGCRSKGSLPRRLRRFQQGFDK